MNLTKLFETQRKLDERIVKEKGLEGQDLLPEKILALQVELGELANEWRGFKFWSEDREPRAEVTSNITVDGVLLSSATKNPLLEEYVDCLHFILSIGLDLGIDTNRQFTAYKGLNSIKQFSFVFHDAAELDKSITEDWGQEFILEVYTELCMGLVGLGEMLDFTWDQIEQAYYDKNKINHERQANGY